MAIANVTTNLIGCNCRKLIEGAKGQEDVWTVNLRAIKCIF